MKKTQLLKKSCKIAATVLLYVFIAVCIFGVILTIVSKRDADSTVTVLGRQMRLVLSPSMEKSDATDVSTYKIKDIPTGSMVFIEVVPDDEAKASEWYKNLKVGDVLTFKYVYVKQETITHRITAIQAKSTGGYIISLEGDNKNSESDALTQIIDTSVKNSPNYVVGKVTGQSYLLGLLVRSLKSPAGLVFIVIIPSMVIVSLEILKIVKLLSADKKEREQAERERHKRELDELKLRLAELESQNPASEHKNLDLDGGTP